MIAAAGAAMTWALLLRWQRCLGGYESAECQLIQSHEYDYLLPSDPWTSIPGAAQLEGAGYLLLAAGLALGATRYVVRPVGRVVWAILLGLFALVGLLTLWSGLIAAPLPVNLLMAPWWFLLEPVLLVGAAVVVARAALDDRVRPLFVATLLVLLFTHGLLEFLIFVMAYVSYDTPPWTGSLRAVLLLVLGLAIAARAAVPARDTSPA